MFWAPVKRDGLSACNETTPNLLRSAADTGTSEVRPLDSPVTGREGDPTGGRMTGNDQDFLEKTRRVSFLSDNMSHIWQGS